jgi:phosphopantetheinyl transferase
MSEPGVLIEKTVFIGIGKIQLVIAEGFCDVYDALSSDEQIEMNQFLAKKRRAEFGQIRFLKNQVFQGVAIGYRENGQPYLEGRTEYIGISHTHNIGLFSYSNIPFGCDLEAKSNRFLKLFSRYTTEEESELLPNLNTSDRYCVLWVCKEAIYKLLNRPGILWREDCKLNRVNFPKLTFEMRSIHSSSMITCHVEEFQEKAWMALAYHIINE